jgi:hypothetical protein
MALWVVRKVENRPGGQEVPWSWEWSLETSQRGKVQNAYPFPETHHLWFTLTRVTNHKCSLRYPTVPLFPSLPAPETISGQGFVLFELCKTQIL